MAPTAPTAPAAPRVPAVPLVRHLPEDPYATRRLVITGTRNDRDDFERHADAWVEVFGRPYLILGGDRNKGRRSQRGVDLRAFRWGRARGFHGTVVYANWDEGDHAGRDRNVRMVSKAERPDHALGFPGPDSSGTWHCLRCATQAGLLSVPVVKPDDFGWLDQLIRMVDEGQRAAAKAE
jgi:hypothetical protein